MRDRARRARRARLLRRGLWGDEDRNADGHDREGRARAAFETAFPPANACFSCNRKTLVTVIGVGFFDKLHGQHGVAVNGAELHPVIGFLVGGAPSPTTTTTNSTTTQPTTTTETTPAPTPPPVSRHGNGCNRYPGRHWFKHKYHRYCRSYFFFTKYGSR